MDYPTLIADKNTTGSIKRFTNYSQIDPDTILEDAQGLIYQRLRVREMRAYDDTLQLSIGDSTLDLPDGFLDPVYLKDTTNLYEIRPEDMAMLAARRQYDLNTGLLLSGNPMRYAIFGEQMNFEYQAQVVTNLFYIFYKTPDPLSTQNKTNFLTKRYPHVLRTFCLAAAADFMRNEADYQRYMQRGSALIEDLAARDDLLKRGEDMDLQVPGY